LFSFHQIDQVEVEFPQQRVGGLPGEQTLSFEYIMQVRLRDPGSLGYAAFGELASPNALIQMMNQPAVKVFEGHHSRYFLEK
jgi:hypothetical protein